MGARVELTEGEELCVILLGTGRVRYWDGVFAVGPDVGFLVLCIAYRGFRLSVHIR
jgi:hypothetical protein